MVCDKCGANNPDGALFCYSCGEKLPINGKESSQIVQNNNLNNQPVYKESVNTSNGREANGTATSGATMGAAASAVQGIEYSVEFDEGLIDYDGTGAIIMKKPIAMDKGAKKYDFLYPIFAAVGVVVALILDMFGQAAFSGYLAVIVGFIAGLAVGFIIKNFACMFSSFPLRNKRFSIKNKIPYEELHTKLIPVMNQIGGKVEAIGGLPSVTYKGTIYQIEYNDDNSFTIGWAKSFARAFLGRRIYTGIYRDSPVVMGIVGYYVQQICGTAKTEPSTDPVKVIKPIYSGSGKRTAILWSILGAILAVGIIITAAIRGGGNMYSSIGSTQTNKIQNDIYANTSNVQSSSGSGTEKSEDIIGTWALTSVIKPGQSTPMTIEKYCFQEGKDYFQEMVAYEFNKGMVGNLIKFTETSYSNIETPITYTQAGKDIKVTTSTNFINFILDGDTLKSTDSSTGVIKQFKKVAKVDLSSMVNKYRHTEDETKSSSATSQASSHEVQHYSPDDFILPDAQTRIYDKAYLESLGAEKLRLARNEILARHGRIYKSEDLNQYFSSKPWYHGTIPADDFDPQYETILNDYEKANIDLIRQIEEGDVKLDLPGGSIEMWASYGGNGRAGFDMTLKDDGSFTGTDWWMGSMIDPDDGYEEPFSGKFGSIVKRDDYSYSMVVESVEGADVEYFTKGTQYILYLPGTPVSQLSSDFIEGYNFGELRKNYSSALSSYALYNTRIGRGF